LTHSSSIAGHKASSFLLTQRHAAFRNSALQKLQQTIFGDVMANEQSAVSRVADSSGYFKNLDLLGNASERALLWGHGDAV
jgi:hypothetical protein